MRFVLLFKNDRDTEVDVPPCQYLAEMETLADELTRSGVLLATEGLQPSSRGARVRVAGDRVAVTDGPFAEAKELVAGFALVEVASKQDAIDLAARFPRIAGQGSAEVRQAFGPDDAAAERDRAAGHGR